jgi:hypothetical protein
MTDSNIAVTAAIIAAIAAIASACISALTSYSASKRSGVQKIAEFRKEWIENLRVHFAEFHSTYFRLALLVMKYRRAKDAGQKHQFGEQMHDGFVRLQYLHNYIILMLNPAEELHQQMESRVRQMVTNLVEDEETDERGASTPNVSDLQSYSDLARKILKAEWNRLKSET